MDVKCSKVMRRKCLGELANREYNLMIEHFKSKKKVVAKKIMNKLENIRWQNLENLLDDYFEKVCYDFYRRQMLIWLHVRSRNLKADAWFK